VRNFQGDYGLVTDGIAGCATWSTLAELVHNNGPSSTTIN